MKRLARVRYSYNPVNSDELELIAGQLIEVQSEEEEGWWRGKLDGREGVFPSNFVEITTDTSPSLVPTPPSSNNYNYINNNNHNGNNTSNHSYNTSNSNLNNQTNNSIDNRNNNCNNSSGARSQMDSQQQHEDDSTASAERKPKPVRGVGFGDIFAGGKPKLSPIDAAPNLGADRHNNILSNNIHKAIPKKPPPPAPVSEVNSDSSSEAAPVLPPKPSSAQLSASLSQASSHAPSASHLMKSSPYYREQARVIYNYEAQNNDELTIEEGDIINVISKQIEDQGWWKGELNGKIGVFPDNFVELIRVPVAPQEQGFSPDLLPHRMQKPSRPPPVVLMGAGSLSMVMPNENKIQSISTTPKGMSKDLETSSDRSSVGSSASFLSLNRNKFGGSSSNKPPVAAKSPMQPSSLTAMHNKADSMPDREQHSGLYHLSKDSNSINMGLGGRNHMNNNSFDSFTSHDSNASHTPGKLNHLTAQRAKGPSSRRPPSNILVARDNVSDNSLDLYQNGDVKEALNHSNQSNESQSSLNSSGNNGTSQLTTAINANKNNPLQNNNKTVTPPTNTKTDTNQDYSAKLQKSPPQPKDTTPTSAVPHWMVELREKTTKKAHSEKADKKRDSSTEEHSMITSSNFASNSNTKHADSPIVSNVAPVKASPPFNRDQSYQQTSTSNITGGVKNLTSRYSGEFSLTDKGMASTSTQNLSADPLSAGSNETSPGVLTKQSAINSSHHGKSNSSVNNRSSFTPNTLSSTRQQEVEGSMVSHRNFASGTSPHSPADNHNVPTPNNFSFTSPQYHGSNILTSHENLNQVQAASSSYTAQQLQNSSQNQSSNKLLNNKNNSPSDSNSAVNDIQLNSAQHDLLKHQQQQIVLNNSEIENLKEEIKRLKEEFQKVPKRDEIVELKSLIDSQKRTHGSLIKDLINDLADERKKTATMQIEIDRLQKLTSAV